MYCGTLERLEKEGEKVRNTYFHYIHSTWFEEEGAEAKIDHVLLKLIVILNELLKLIQ